MAFDTPRYRCNAAEHPKLFQISSCFLRFLQIECESLSFITRCYPMLPATPWAESVTSDPLPPGTPFPTAFWPASPCPRQASHFLFSKPAKTLPQAAMFPEDERQVRQLGFHETPPFLPVSRGREDRPGLPGRRWSPWPRCGSSQPHEPQGCPGVMPAPLPFLRCQA